MSSATKTPHVLILGAGLGGLTLAQALRKKGVTFEIFERDASIHARFQGWAIALHKILADFKASVPEDLGPVESTSHLLPLQLPAEFCMYIRNERVSQVISSDQNPLVRSNRSRLREYLSAHLDIKWGKRVTRIEEHGDSVSMHFEDGSSATGDVLVGADGVHSQVRTHLCDGQDPYLRSLNIEQVVGQPRLNKDQYERQLKLAHSAYVTVIQNTHRVFTGLNSIEPDAEHANYYWMYFNSKPEGNFDLNTASQQEMLNHALDRTQDLSPQLSEIIHLSKAEDMMAHVVFLHQVELTSMPNRRVTLLGDAAHAMMPHRGEGGNHALQDALNLARTLAASKPQNLLHGLKEYQDEMIARGQDALKRSLDAAMDDGQGTTQGWGSWDKQLKSTSTPMVVAH